MALPPALLLFAALPTLFTNTSDSDPSSSPFLFLGQPLQPRTPRRHLQTLPRQRARTRTRRRTPLCLPQSKTPTPLLRTPTPNPSQYSTSSQALGASRVPSHLHLPSHTPRRTSRIPTTHSNTSLRIQLSSLPSSRIIQANKANLAFSASATLTVEDASCLVGLHGSRMGGAKKRLSVEMM